MPEPVLPTVTGVICTCMGVATLGIAMVVGLVFVVFDQDTARHKRIRLLAGKALIISIPTMLFGTIGLVAVANMLMGLMGFPSEW